MNFITKWLTICSNCFNHRNFSTNENSSSQLSDYQINIYNLAKHCLHISNKNDLICYKCFINFFGYDRFIIRQLFIYLNYQQTNSIDIKQFYIFAERIINWNEFINHIDFILQLFYIILNIKINFNDYSFINLLNLLEDNTINSLLIYELMTDAFFFTTLQSNLTNQSQIFLQKFVNYFSQLNQKHNCKNYLTLIKRIIPWAFISIHKWLKTCLLSTDSKRKSLSIISNEFNTDLPLTFLWYITNWLVSNKVFPNEYDPIIIFEKISSQQFITNIYNSDKHGYSLVTLCKYTYDIDGPILMMFYCTDEKIFAILLEGKLMDSAKAYGGRSSLCLQLSAQFLILERGPAMLYWNVKTRSNGPLGIRIGHHGLIQLSLDLNLEYIHHSQGSSSINRIEIYKLGSYKIPRSTSMILHHSIVNKQYNLFSVDAHKLAETIGIHLFT
ncbi:unnamed protein product [Adineta steineri]|uniref:TLDc domain-containing protein n=1 Tax=Adineta steineri TaxID=433720 RepID=A0A815CZZ6_9BILA|nr:unnamed protein product [Adineta steineri]